MYIKELNSLEETVISEVKELVSQCHNQDGPKGMIALDTSFNFNKDMNTIYLAYEGGKLVSAMTLFLPTKAEAEISAMTLPEYRMKGFFGELVKRAEKEMKKYGVSDLLFVCEGESVSGKAAIAKQGAQYEFTEYLLNYNHALDSRLSSYDFRIKLHKVSIENLEGLIQVSMEAFGDSYEEAKSFGMGVLNAENRQMFLAEAEGSIIAMGAAVAVDQASYIHGLGVLPEYQGKGYGREMLYAVIKKLLEQGVENINIEVESKNENAYQLYKNSGFEIHSSWEYYRRAVE